MTKNQTVNVKGYWLDQPDRCVAPLMVSLGTWDGVEDAEDESIFFYMDDLPLNVGDTIADGFVVTAIEKEDYK